MKVGRSNAAQGAGETELALVHVRRPRAFIMKLLNYRNGVQFLFIARCLFVYVVLRTHKSAAAVLLHKG